MEFNTGNVSTLATWIAIAVTAILSYAGIEYDYTALVPVVSGIITLIIAIWSSKNPNNMDILGNGSSSQSAGADDIFDNDAPVLNDEYESRGDDGC